MGKKDRKPFKTVNIGHYRGTLLCFYQDNFVQDLGKALVVPGSRCPGSYTYRLYQTGLRRILMFFCAPEYFLSVDLQVTA
ncbi:hypothetical protein XELAEV_18011516mg [Xenopus laevis]|uniref:Uncharacterized protein n=1 Tax=Xenopus laevis TaxID=8355 RepID=A0A974HXI9_XENLA|nr:hypothetical protein XELAEV_18011516mg [Xenopus laevis]